MKEQLLISINKFLNMTEEEEEYLSLRALRPLGHVLHLFMQVT